MRQPGSWSSLKTGFLEPPQAVVAMVVGDRHHLVQIGVDGLDAAGPYDVLARRLVGQAVESGMMP